MVAPPSPPALRKLFEDMMPCDHSLDSGILFGSDLRYLDVLTKFSQFANAIPEPANNERISGPEQTKYTPLTIAERGHTFLPIGLTGKAKSLPADAIPEILAKLSDDEKVQSISIYSVRGQLDQDGMAMPSPATGTVPHSASMRSIYSGTATFASQKKSGSRHLRCCFSRRSSILPHWLYKVRANPAKHVE